MQNLIVSMKIQIDFLGLNIRIRIEVGTWTVGLGTDFYGNTQYTSVHTVKAPVFKA